MTRTWRAHEVVSWNEACRKKKTVYEGKGIKLKSLWEITVLMSGGMIATQIFTNIFALRAMKKMLHIIITLNTISTL